MPPMSRNLKIYECDILID